MAKYIYNFLIFLKSFPSNTIVYRIVDQFLDRVSVEDLDKVMAVVEKWLEKLKKRHAESVDGKR
jgi:hypothetical protein